MKIQVVQHVDLIIYILYYDHQLITQWPSLKLNIRKTKIMASSLLTSWQIDGETMQTVKDFILGGSQITADGDCSHEIKRRLLLGRKAVTNLKQHIKKQRYYFADKDPSSQRYGFSSSHVWMWELDHKAECQRIDAFELWCWRRLFESPLDCKEIHPAHPKGNQSWIFSGRTDAEAEVPTLWPPDVKSWLLGKDRDARKDWRREEKGTTEDEMAGWHHRLGGHESERAPGVDDGQGGLACCGPWGLGARAEPLDWTGLCPARWWWRRCCAVQWLLQWLGQSASLSAALVVSGVLSVFTTLCIMSLKLLYYLF